MPRAGHKHLFDTFGHVLLFEEEDTSISDEELKNNSVCGLTTSQIATAPKHEVDREPMAAGLTTSQFATAPKLYNERKIL